MNTALRVDVVTTDRSDGTTRVADVILRSRAALTSTDAWDQARADDVVRSVGWECYREPNATALAQMSFDATGLGNVDDLRALHLRRVLGTMRDLDGQASVGLVALDSAAGTQTWAKPLGVVAVITPATAPCTTVATNVLSLLKTRNSVVISPHPSAVGAVEQQVEMIRTGLSRVGADPDLVQLLRSRDRDTTSELMSSADHVVATGGSGTVQRAYRSGTPAVSAGTGNSTIIVDDWADLQVAAARIGAGAGFNHGTSCSSESNVLVAPDRLDEFLAALEVNRAFVCSTEQSAVVERALWSATGAHDRDLIGRSATYIAAHCSIDLPSDRTVDALVLRCDRPEPGRPIFTEKLAPVVTVAPYRDFSSAVADLGAILAISGLGHSCGIYTGTHEAARRRVDEVASKIRACRVMVNQTTMGNAGSFENGLPFTSVVASGSWGGCSRSENVTFRHFMNTTVVSTPIEARMPTEADIFGAYVSH